MGKRMEEGNVTRGPGLPRIKCPASRPGPFLDNETSRNEFYYYYKNKKIHRFCNFSFQKADKVKTFLQHQQTCSALSTELIKVEILMQDNFYRHTRGPAQLRLT